LGLSIAKNFVEEMGGKLAFVSVVGIGTTFHFTLAHEVCVEVCISISPAIRSTTEPLELTIKSATMETRRPRGAMRTWAPASVPHGVASDVGEVETVELLSKETSTSLSTIRQDQSLQKIPLLVESGPMADNDAGADADGSADACAGTGAGADDRGSFRASASKRRRRRSVVKKSPAMRVLVVDDISTNRMLLTRILLNIAARVEIPAPVIVTAEHGCEAVDTVAATFATEDVPFNLILLDRQMPHMDGVEAARLIKELQDGHFGVGSAQSAHVVGMSASIDTGEWLAAGADTLMGKPCPDSDLETLMQYIVPTWIPVNLLSSSSK
jgi:CheY-like chemotaxis protein